MAAMKGRTLDARELERRQRERKRRDRSRYELLEELFFRHDPIRIAAVRDEYDPEVGLLLPKLDRVRSERELTDEIFVIFQRMFSPEIAGARKSYEPIARDIWQQILKR